MLRTYQPKKLHRKRSTVSERECLMLTAARFWPAEELRVERSCLTKIEAT